MPIDNDAALDAIRQGSNSFKVLVATLGGKPDEVKRVVKRLRHAGAIDVDGHSRGARYRVANDAPRERTPTRSAPPQALTPAPPTAEEFQAAIDHRGRIAVRANGVGIQIRPADALELLAFLQQMEDVIADQAKQGRRK